MLFWLKLFCLFDILLPCYFNQGGEEAEAVTKQRPQEGVLVLAILVEEAAKMVVTIID